MEISENWLRGLGGWKAFKQAQSLQGSGGTLSARRDDNTLHGNVRSGTRALSSGLKITSESDVTNLCSCPQSRRDGQICPHSIAVALQWLADQNNTTEESEPTNTPASNATNPTETLHPQFRLAADLEKTWPRSLLSLRLQWPANETQLQEGSAKNLADWIRNQGLNPGKEAAINLRGNQLDIFLQAMAMDEWPLLNTDNSPPLQVSNIPFRPKAHLETSTSGRLRITASPPPGNILPGEKDQWLWLQNSNELRRLAAAPAEWSTLEQNAWAPLLSEGGSREVTIAWFLENQEALATTLDITDHDKVKGMTWGQDVPMIHLELDGSPAHLIASLSFKYGNTRCEITSDHAKQNQRVAYTHNENGTQIVQLRDTPREQQALEFLLTQGFNPSPKLENKLIIKGENAVFTYLAEELTTLPQNWTITMSPRLRQLHRELSTVRVNLEPVSSGEDWLGAELQFEVEGQGTLSHKEVMGLLRTGRRHFRLPNGKRALINLRELADMEEALRDIEPQQERGRFHFNKSQLPYLRAVLGQTPAETTLPDKLNTNRLQAKLRDYQNTGSRWLSRQADAGLGSLLADDMGLGKTLQTITCIEHRLSETEAGKGVKQPFLVVCPTSLLENWHLELQRFIPHRQALVIHGSGRKKYFDVMGDADIVLTSYNLLHRDLEEHKKQDYGGVVLDEASLVRNPDSKMARAAHALQSPVRIALTGTPVENSVRDLWSVFEFLQPGYLGRKSVFRERYELPMTSNPPDPGAGRRLRLRVAPFLLRRMKQDVAKDLPDKIMSTEWCVMNKDQATVYEQLLREARNLASGLGNKQGSGAARLSMLTSLLRLRQACCDLSLLPGWKQGTHGLEQSSAKRARLLELLREAVAGGHKVLVFSQFVSLLERVRDDILAEGWDHCWLTGASQDRGAQVARFQQNNTPIFLISLKAGGYGLNLTAADTVIHLDPWWNPAVEDQATDRAHRIGQKRPVTAYKFITKGTVEEKILRLQEKKREAMATTLNESTPLMQGLSDSEILDLLA